MDRKKLAIIGASYLQLPLITKAKKRNIETHVFAWECGDQGESEADFFYPISIVEKERILEECRRIGINGICSIASDVAVLTVNYVASDLGLRSNSIESAGISTNKLLMRQALQKNNDPIPAFTLHNSEHNELSIDKYPVIVKPVDRSGSRGVTKVEKPQDLEEALMRAKETSFSGDVLIEECIEGDEYSIECISWNGEHTLLNITKKYTTGAPNFVEIAHYQPAGLDDGLIKRVKEIVFHALDSLQIRYGASHSEVKINEDGVFIIEIGSRMGGDHIGSKLVELSTGYDFVNAVIDCSLNIKPQEYIEKSKSYSGIRYFFSEEEIDSFLKSDKNGNSCVVEIKLFDSLIGNKSRISDSSTRLGYYVVASDSKEDIIDLLMV